MGISIILFLLLIQFGICFTFLEEFSISIVECVFGFLILSGIWLVLVVGSLLLYLPPILDGKLN